MLGKQDSEEPDCYSLDYDVSTPHSPVASEQRVPSKKKRKAWGQPIPEFEKIIGPRKRAKTEAEKTQRAHERTLRNRRAAAHSRDKKQAQFAAMEIENQTLREQLAQYQARFGALPNGTQACSGLADRQLPPANLDPYPTPSSDATSNQEFSATDPVVSRSTISILGPVLSEHAPDSEISPTLAPTLQLNPNSIHEDIHYSQQDSPLLLSSELPDAAQYSAAVLLDQQCQASADSTSQIRRLEMSNSFRFNLHLLNLTILMTTFENFSNTMLKPMYQIFRTLAGDFSMRSMTQEVLDQHFQLIYCLIMSPMRGTDRPVFRMKLLSRLLACNPVTARLITVAADRALQRQVTEGWSFGDPESCRKWASLLTLKWTIKWLKNEHARYREARRASSSLAGCTESGVDRMKTQGTCHQGVDYRAVERSSWRWDGVEFPDLVEACDVVGLEQAAH